MTSHAFSLADTPDLAGRVAVVTGGSAGIGRELCAQLLLHGAAKIYVLARSESRFADARVEWSEKHALSDSDLARRVDFIRCDLTDVDAVQRAARQLSQRLDRLDVLILNAALPPSADYQLSPQGVEIQFAGNHLGHFVLTNLLFPLVEKTASERGQARILTVSSSLHLACQELSLPLLTSPTPIKSPAALDSFWRYARSKLANILFTRELARRIDHVGLSNVYVNSFFPGNIPTDAWDSWKDLFGTLVGTTAKDVFQQAGHTHEDAAATGMYLATSPDVVSKGVKGKYFVPVSQEEETSTISYDKDLQKNLWYWSDSKVAETLGKGWQSA
ncbi:short-chain dehydrogenase [Diplodia corticola]|uniref:Short-chain dehydrogenase n=1 Tax=Diplodia corticola TaxID=236234 RepID=A0A1J9RW56_9PEZI|nr:short-chain dehydrogenase [Diplodia corticola]OJD31709.1 short-chain dehydrogenase [Diplodia corticola]